MFEASVEQWFAAAHALRGYKGKCERLHGHNYKIRVTLEGEQLDDVGLLYDFTEIKRMVKEISERLDHRYLNEVPPFDVINASAENLAKYFFDEMAARLAAQAGAAVRVKEVTIWETESNIATYRA